GYSGGGDAVVATLYVAMAEVVDYTSAPANCYIVSEADKGYRIDVSRIPGSDRRIEPATVDYMWMTSSKMLQYLTLHDDGTVSFFAPAEDGKVYPGSALIGAYDKAGDLLWCWHLWVTDFDPEAEPVALNGKLFMACNLGAFGNSTAAETDILDSYGLYYQWGRPTPFMRPRYYNCASGYSTYVYNSKGSQIYMTLEEAQPVQSMAYAMENPLVFLTDLSSWDVDTWVDDSKSSYDPCPAGWRVPQSDAFDGLGISPEELDGDLATLSKAYGWTLTDGAQSAFFFAGGRRTYLDGMVVNMNTAERPEPWAGFYWTSGRAADGKHGCLFFELDTDAPEQSRLLPSRELQRSNGLQIRCVKE
ncbi:MAG: fibrobacter succinogenes major paralogous domain-containing protein, partial [Alistipes sp.]|nr:fibrobacter succinogenes major paralogous domain-containing protein [Alistipes sp.]